jgi:hypothetical protein
MNEPRYHLQDDVIGFCGDFRHPWGCQDDEMPADSKAAQTGDDALKARIAAARKKDSN